MKGLCRLRTWLLFAPLGVLALPGCASMSKSECLTVDWHERGIRDGRDGYARARFHEHEKTCAKHGVSPDSEAYYAGREIGLAHYCTPEGGYQAGRRGGGYAEVCPLEVEQAFLDAFREGRELYEVEAQMEEIQRQINSKELQIADEDTSDEERRLLQSEVNGLNARYRLLSEELIRLERDSRW